MTVKEIRKKMEEVETFEEAEELLGYIYANHLEGFFTEEELLALADWTDLLI